MKTIAFILTISLLIVISSANGHVNLTGPGSFSNVRVYYKYSKIRGYTYKVVADMDFNLPSTYTVTRTVKGSICTLYVDLTTSFIGGATTVTDAVLLDYTNVGAKATTYILYMKKGTSITSGDTYFSKGADVEL